MGTMGRGQGAAGAWWSRGVGARAAPRSAAWHGTAGPTVHQSLPPHAAVLDCTRSRKAIEGGAVIEGGATQGAWGAEPRQGDAPAGATHASGAEHGETRNQGPDFERLCTL